GVQRRDARQVHVACLAVDDAAHDDMADAGRIDLGARDRFLDRDRAELRRRHVLQRHAVIADGGAGSRNNDDFSHCNLPWRSCASARSMWTSRNSPAFPPLNRTTPSISGASALERPTPASSTSTFRVLPTLALSFPALIFS